ncbi:MAG: hypothetical protein OZSIB_2804 [Candidatus Ozemobacter sibiricus]|jgi:hypothetical protein|uniref:Uncharacterized protein n=1 Tax=Candidatus Ozemobacter sibiricus TaxID=2268124 RepID=A0A367ZSA9_9BACT|nr:MAG: hypothetical protein OZSIB_2804 [Candidatus Ozemobacter sibiricus]
MKTLTFRHRRELSVFLVLGMVLSLSTVTVPKVQAGILQTAGSLLKTVVINGGALAAGYMGGVLGIALGGGPIGMVAGAVGGFIIGKKVLTWTTASVANAATVGGAIAGGLLCAGMGFPLLAAGVVGGALVARFGAQMISKLFQKVTGKPAPVVDLKAQDAKAQAFIDQLTKPAPAAAAPAPAPVAKAIEPDRVDPSQGAYEKYLAAYKAYMTATQNGNAAEAQKAYAEYKKYLDLYNASLGKK